MRVLLVCFAVAASTSCLQPTNPFDPEATLQKEATLSGAARAVFARDENGAPAVVGGCAPVVGDDVGDHDGFLVTLRGADNNGVAQSFSGITQPGSVGRFEFRGAPPGTYSLEVQREGFAAPPAFEVTLGPGDTRDVGTLCAFNVTGPPTPTLSPVPPLVRRSAEGIAVTILDAPCEADTAGCAVAWTFEQRADDDALTVPAGPPSGERERVVLTQGADGLDRRASIRVRVVAYDGLGNPSVPNETVVVVDDLAPAPPSVQATVGRDRVSLTLTPVVQDGDDGAAAFSVWYGVADRTADGVCPFGRPTFDAAGNIVDTDGRATFAVEGQSPIVTTNTTPTLSGIAPGTDVVVHVAAVDLAGNVGCYGDAVRVRPDVVTLAPAHTRPLPGGVPRAVAFIDGAIDGVVAVARADGLRVTDGESAVDPAVAGAGAVLDVKADGRRFVAAAAELGLQVLPLDGAGHVEAAGIETIGVGGRRVTSVALRANVAVAGSDDGAGGGTLTIVDLEDGSLGATAATADGVVDVLGFGPLVVAATRSTIEVRRRAQPTELVARVDQGGIVDATVHDDAVVVAAGLEGVSAYDLGFCDDAGTCLDVRARRRFPRNGEAIAVAAFDEFIAALVKEADTTQLVFLDPRNALSLVGRQQLTDAPTALVVDDGLVCTVGAVLTCFSPIAGSIDSERRLLTQTPVLRARAAGGTAVVFASTTGAGAPFSVVRAPLSSMVSLVGPVLSAPPAVPDGRVVNPIGGVVLDDGRAIVVDQAGAVHAFSPLAFEPAVRVGAVDVSGIGDGDDVVSGFVERSGSALLLALFVRGQGHVLVRTSLVENAQGVLSLGPQDRLDLAPAAENDVEQNANLVLRGGVAHVPTVPFGVLRVRYDDDDLAFVADSVLPVGGDDRVDDLAFAALDGAATGAFLLATRGGRDGVYDAAAPFTEIVAPDFLQDANAMTGLQRFLVVASRQEGLVTVLQRGPGEVALRRVLDVPSATQAEDVRATARGLLISDGLSGVLRVSLR